MNRIYWADTALICLHLLIVIAGACQLSMPHFAHKSPVWLYLFWIVGGMICIAGDVDSFVRRSHRVEWIKWMLR